MVVQMTDLWIHLKALLQHMEENMSTTGNILRECETDLQCYGLIVYLIPYIYAF